MSFADRAAAGWRLAEALERYRVASPVVIALPRGGVPVAEPVAVALQAPLDLVLVRKIGAPGQPELAMGAVAERRRRAVVRNSALLRALAVTDRAFDAACTRELKEIDRRRRLYLAGRSSPSLDGRVAIVVDDGIATGATMLAALRAIRAEAPAKIVLAVPVAPKELLPQLRQEADDVVCLESHHPFVAVGLYYRDFHQLTDEDVVAALDRMRDARESKPSSPEPSTATTSPGEA